MLQAVTHSLTAVIVLVIVAGVGWVTARKGWYDEKGRTLVSKLVNCAIPFFLFYSVTSKFTHDQLMELLNMAFLPFLVVALNFLISVVLVKLKVVREDIHGAFIACFTSSTVLFCGRAGDDCHVRRNGPSVSARVLLCQRDLHLDDRALQHPA